MSNSCKQAQTATASRYRMLPAPEDLASLEKVSPGSAAMFERVAIIADQIRALREHKDVQAARVLRLVHRATLLTTLLLAASLIPVSNFVWDRGFASAALVLRGALAILLIGTLGEVLGQHRERVRRSG